MGCNTNALCACGAFNLRETAQSVPSDLCLPCLGPACLLLSPSVASCSHVEFPGCVYRLVLSL